jgi:hypothetical protein
MKLDISLLKKVQALNGELESSLHLPLWLMKGIQLDYQDKMCKEEHSRIDIHSSMTRRMIECIFHCNWLKLEMWGNTLLLIHIYLNLECLDLSMDIHKYILTALLSGNLNSEILLMDARLWLISSFAQERLSGEPRLDWYCYFLTDLMDKVQNIPQPDWKDTCNFATMTNL